MTWLSEISQTQKHKHCAFISKAEYLVFKRYYRDEERPQWLRALLICAEDLVLIPSTHMAVHTVYKSSCRESDLSSDLLRLLHACILQTYTQTHIHIRLKK